MILLPVLLVLGLRKRRHRIAVCKTLDAIRASPELKAQIEALSGVALPESPKCCVAAAGGSSGKSKACFVLRAVGTFLIIVVTSLIIATTSLLIAGGIVGSMSTTGADGTTSHPSALVAILVLLLVTGIEVLLFVGVMRGCKLMWSARHASASAYPATVQGPSAPPMDSPSSLSQPLVNVNVSAAAAEDNNSSSPRYRSFFARVAGVTRRLPALLGSVGGPFVYSQLPAGPGPDDENSSSVEYVEMSAYPPSTALTGSIARAAPVVQYQYPTATMVQGSVPLPVHHQSYVVHGPPVSIL